MISGVGLGDEPITFLVEPAVACFLFEFPNSSFGGFGSLTPIRNGFGRRKESSGFVRDLVLFWLFHGPLLG